MKKQLSSFVIFLLVSCSFAQGQTALEQNLRKHVEYLASEKLEGRRTGEKGATDAASYVAKEFKKSRLKTGFKTSFLQPFPYVAGVALGSDNFLRIVSAEATGENKMEIGVNWMPLGYSMSGDIPSTEIVFAGFGVTTPEAKYDDYAGLDVKDKIVLMFDSTPDAGNPHSAFTRFNIHTKANIAKDKGAKAIVLIASDNDFKSDRLSRLSFDRTLGETALPVVGIMREHGAELLGAADAKGLTAIEVWLANKANAPPTTQPETWKAPGEPVTVKATAQIKIQLVKKQVDATNVIGILEGTDPQLKNEAIIIGAHYDHLGRGGAGSLAANSTDIHYGADDNASGTSAVLELARQFAKSKNNKRTIIFMAFGGEEEGLLGSKYYVNNPVWPLDKTIAMINLDMVGRLNENKLTVGGIGTAREWKPLIEKLTPAKGAPPTTSGDANLRIKAELDSRLATLGESGVQTQVTDDMVSLSGYASPARYADVMRIVTDAGGRSKLNNQVIKMDPAQTFALQLNEDGFGPSDHSSFYGKQIPVLFFFTGTHTDYHKPTDTFDKVNYDGLTRITNYVGEIVKNINQSQAKPTYTLAKSSGQMGQVRMNVSLGTIPSYGDTTDGMVLDGVRENSPAAKAGLKAGDKVVKLAGKDVRNAMDYTYVLGSMKAGEEYEVELIRGTERMKLKIIPAPAARRP